MQITLLVSIAFVCVSLVFLVLTFFDHVKNGSTITIARRIKLRMALMFGVVAVGLLFLHILFRF